MFGSLQSFLGVLFAVVLLGDHVTALQLAGGAVVIGSGVLSRSGAGRRGRRLRRRPPDRPRRYAPAAGA
jgi:drug/metabolite transporter (DMT)-like permease